MCLHKFHMLVSLVLHNEQSSVQDDMYYIIYCILPGRQRSCAFSVLQLHNCIDKGTGVCVHVHRQVLHGTSRLRKPISLAKTYH